MMSVSELSNVVSVNCPMLSVSELSNVVSVWIVQCCQCELSNVVSVWIVQCCQCLNCPFLISSLVFSNFFLFQVHLALNDNHSFIFSSPGHRPCELLSWVSVLRPSVRPSVSFSHLNLLLWNRWTEITQTCQKRSLDGPLPDLCFWCWFEIQHGCQGP
jgi:hypothetical protein